MASRGFTKTASRIVGPIVLLLLFLILLRLPFNTNGLGYFMPDVGLIYVYYFTLHRPTVAPLWVVLLVGVFIDVMDGMPIGTTSLIFILVSAFLHSQRRFFINRSFAVTWAGFAILTLVTKAVQWVVLQLLASGGLPINVMLAALLMTVLTFPAFGWLFGRYDRFALR